MKSKFAWFSIMLFGVILFGMFRVYAADVQPEPVDSVYQEDHTAKLEEIGAKREAVIEELVQIWFMDIPDWEAEFRSLLNSANDSKLLAILNSASYAEVQAVLSGGTPDFYSADNMADPFTLGDTDKDFVYTPVKPCRIVDTRIAGGSITSGSSRGFYVYGSGGQMSSQGGNAAGCTSPRGEPQAVHINIVAVYSVASGYLTVWPYGASKPLAGVLNYFPGRTDPISNAFTVKTGFAMGRDINVYAHRTTDVVADVMGYYYNVDEDDFKVRFAGNGSYDITFLELNGGCTNHTSVSIFVPGPGKIMVTAQAKLSLYSHIEGTADFLYVLIGSSPTDCTKINLSQGYNYSLWLIPKGYCCSWSGQGLFQTFPVSRTFTVTTAGTYTYYLNGLRETGDGIGSAGLVDSAIQAVYYPDM